jgi:hypothetical protein
MIEATAHGGSEAGQEATEYWAGKAAAASNVVSEKAYSFAGHVSALWTPETADETGTQLVLAGGGTALQLASEIGAVRAALNGAKLGSNSRLMASIKFSPSERSLAIISRGKRVLDIGVHAIGESPLGSARQVPHINFGAGTGVHTVTNLFCGMRWIH